VQVVQPNLIVQRLDKDKVSLPHPAHLFFQQTHWLLIGNMKSCLLSIICTIWIKVI